MGNTLISLRVYLTTVVVVFLLCISSWLPASIVAKVSSNRCISSTPVLREVVVEAGPFDLQKRYPSMQGPWAQCNFQMRCLDHHRGVYLKTTQARQIENGHLAMMATGKSAKQLPSHGTPRVGVAASGSSTAQVPPTLYWFTGTKAEVIDAKNRVMSGTEFMCHVNIDSYRANNGALFAQFTPGSSTRLCTLTQGQSSIILPEGFGVPFSSEDNFRLQLQAVNRTANQHPSVKLRCRLYFIADQDAVRPIQALSWAIGFILVNAGQPAAAHGLKQDACDDCCNISTAGKPANWDNLSIGLSNGKQIIGHWAIPCGVHRYQSPVLWPQFSSIGPIRMVWLHAHPFCQSFSLIEYLGKRRTILFTINCRTITSPDIQTSHIDCIRAPRGIRLNPNGRYAMEVTYNNTSGKEQDSMANMGVFFSDLKFKKPLWAVHQ